MGTKALVALTVKKIWPSKAAARCANTVLSLLNRKSYRFDAHSNVGLDLGDVANVNFVILYKRV